MRYVTHIPRELRHEIHIRLPLIGNEKQSKTSCCSEGLLVIMAVERSVYIIIAIYHNGVSGG